MSANISVHIFQSLKDAQRESYVAVGEPARYFADTSKFDLEKSEKAILGLAKLSFSRLDYGHILLLKECGPKNTCAEDGYWIQPAIRRSNETLYQETLRGCAVAPHETREHPY